MRARPSRRKAPQRRIATSTFNRVSAPISAFPIFFFSRAACAVPELVDGLDRCHAVCRRGAGAGVFDARDATALEAVTQSEADRQGETLSQQAR